MTYYSYDARGRGFSSAGSHTIEVDGRPHATAAATSGSFFRGPSWTWSGALGVEWSLHAMRTDRLYELRAPDGSVLGSLRRSLASSSMQLRTVDGRRASVGPRRIMGREQAIALPTGTAAVTRTTRGLNVGRHEQWQLELEDGAAPGGLFPLVMAVPIVLDHRRRRQRSGGAGGGAA